MQHLTAFGVCPDHGDVSVSIGTRAHSGLFRIDMESGRGTVLEIVIGEEHAAQLGRDLTECVLERKKQVN